MFHLHYIIMDSVLLYYAIMDYVLFVVMDYVLFILCYNGLCFIFMHFQENVK